jgi:hypothetical protein
MRTRPWQARTRWQASMSEHLCFPASAGLGDQIGLRWIRGFCHPNPLARKEVTKGEPLLPAITSGSRVLRVEMLTPGLAEALTLGTARRADRKSPTPVARRSAGMLCGLPSHQAWNPKSAPLRDDDWGFGLPPPVRIQGDAPDHGSSTGATRQVEIDQSFYGLEIRRVSDTSRLSDTAANHLAGARQRDRQGD